MAREKSELKSGMGKAMETLVSLIEEVEDLGGSDDDIRRIKTNKALRRQIAELIVSDRVICDRHNVVVDYGMSLADMLAVGKYDWKNNDITTKHFPTQDNGQAEVEIFLVHIGRDMGTDNVLKELDARGLRPAKIEELLALGADQPELQRQFPIIALGSVWRVSDGSRRVACLGRSGAERSLGLRWYGFGWDDVCRFAAVRKSV